MLLFQLAAVIDANSCELELIKLSNRERQDYKNILHGTDAREECDHGEKNGFSMEQLTVIHSVLHEDLRSALISGFRKEGSEALKYWKKCDSVVHEISPVT